jgi:hypothetical protein
MKDWAEKEERRNGLQDFHFLNSFKDFEFKIKGLNFFKSNFELHSK